MSDIAWFTAASIAWFIVATPTALLIGGLVRRSRQPVERERVDDNADR